MQKKFNEDGINLGAIEKGRHSRSTLLNKIPHVTECIDLMSDALRHDMIVVMCRLRRVECLARARGT